MAVPAVGKKTRDQSTPNVIPLTDDRTTKVIFDFTRQKPH